MEIPNYKIEQKLGQGGMATVYLATEVLLNRKVALKIMSPELSGNKGFREGFRREGQTIAQLKHQNIVGIYSIGSSNDIYYMSMEYLSGGSLKEKLSEKKLSFDEAMSILQAVGSGLAHAHSHGFIHRDIKPANILFNEHNVAVLTDFGIAKLQDTASDLTRMGYTAGTAQYMSPEQATTTKIDQRSDIYCLGLVLYEMLTGEKAVYAETDIQAINFHVNAPPPSLPPKYLYLQPILDKALAKRPEDRFSSVQEFLDEFKNADSTTIFTPEALSAVRTSYTQSTINPAIENTTEKNKSYTFPAVAAAITISLGVGAWYGTSHLVNSTDKQETTTSSSPVSSQNTIADTGTVTTQIKADQFSEIQENYKLLTSELDAAAKGVRDILKIAPDNAEAKSMGIKLSDSYYKLATEHLISGKTEDALSIINKSISYLPFHGRSYNFKKSIDNPAQSIAENNKQIFDNTIIEIDNILESKNIISDSEKLKRLYLKAFDIAPGSPQVLDRIKITLQAINKEIRENPETAKTTAYKVAANFPFNTEFLAD
ncbi:MAG: serine/threonine-protein kinase [Thiolinea sp.]